MPPKKQPLFVDLDETLIYAREAAKGSAQQLRNSRRLHGYEAIMRPEAHDLLSICRDGGRQVFLFTNAFFGFALSASQTFSLGLVNRPSSPLR